MARFFSWFACVLTLSLRVQGAESKAPKHSTTGPDWLLTLEHSPRQPHSGQTVTVRAIVKSSITNVVLLYQLVEPGAYIELQDPAFANNWVSLAMHSVSPAGQGSTFSTEIPAAIQQHRRLVRYRLKAQDSDGKEHLGPAASDVPPNRAYFVYDGIPGWKGAIDPRSNNAQMAAPLDFPPEAMQRVQAYHLLAKRRSIENATWREHSQGKEYKYTGTLVVDGEVFDHVGYRARGGVWRYAMGKNMWKIQLPGEHNLQAKDDFGRPYSVPWNKINLRACIQQGDYGNRGEQGMFESVGFRLFNLAGVPAPHTHWIQLRIIDEPKENPPDQYRGDFWGLYLAIENEDGKFLKSHGLPSGNLFKMINGTGELQHHGPDAVTNLSDLFGFMNAYRRGNIPDSWWNTNFDLESYYSYRAISECIHHYDVGDGKNYDYYRNPETGRWQIIPWDIDLTWADNMFGSGEDPFKRKILSRPGFRLEYQNRLREIRDLLFNPEQTGQLIDQLGAVLWNKSGASIAEADRRKWDFHPIMAMGMKAGQGLFYEASRTQDFPGMLEVMKRYVKTRGSWIDHTLLNDSSIPSTPKITACGPPGFPADQLRFSASAYDGANAFAALKWRLAEVRSKDNSGDAKGRSEGPFEMNAIWVSAEMANATDPVAVPPGLSKPGHTYRVRARMKDVTGRWSHWSAPIEFVPR